MTQCSTANATGLCPTALNDQIEVYYKVDRLINGLLGYELDVQYQTNHLYQNIDEVISSKFIIENCDLIVSNIRNLCQDYPYPASLFLESCRTWRFLMSIELVSDDKEPL